MKLTKAEAKRIGIEVWDYLAKHGEIRSKWGLPEHIFDKINGMTNNCPVCEYYTKGLYNSPKIKDCRKCSIGNRNEQYYEINGSCCETYHLWVGLDVEPNNDDRARYASIIRDKIKAW